MANIVLVVDMLNGFLKEGNLANASARRIIPNIKNLLRRKAKEGWKVVFLADNHKKGDLEFQMFPEHCVEGTEETKVVKELQRFVAKDNYVPKTRYSGFFKTNLEEILEAEKPEKVVVVGIYANICVLYTTADLRNRGYEVAIPKDCATALGGPGETEQKTDFIFKHMKNVLGVKVVEKEEEI